MRTLILTFGKFWFYHPITTLQIDCIKCFTITTTSVETEIWKSMIWIVSTAHFSWLLIGHSRLLDRLCHSFISCHLIDCGLRVHRRSSKTNVLCLRLNIILNWGWITFKRWVLFSFCGCWKCGFFLIWKICLKVAVVWSKWSAYNRKWLLYWIDLRWEVADKKDEVATHMADDGQIT